MRTALTATPRTPLFAGFWSKARCQTGFVRALVEWAMTPTQAKADAALGLFSIINRRLDGAERQNLLTTVGRVIEQHEGLAWNQMIFLALHLAEAGLRSSAALNLCVLYPPRESDPLSGPRLVAEMAEDERLTTEQKASCIAGALQLGDPRTMGFLSDAWKRLAPKVREAASFIQPATAQVPYIEFLLEALAWEPVAGIYGALAGQLGRLGSFGDDDNPFITIHRTFPSWAAEDSPFMRVQRFSRSEVLERILPRLYALRDSEKGEPVMPAVIDVWSGKEDPSEDNESGQTGFSSRAPDDYPFDELASLAFILFYNASRPGEERLKDSLCGGLIFAVTQNKTPEELSTLLAAEASIEPNFRDNVRSTAEVVSEFVGSKTFKKMYPPGGNYTNAAQSLAQALYNLFARSHSEKERDKGSRELGLEALSRGLAFGLVLRRDYPELAAKLADSLNL
jgi:hypothetical protein